MAASLDEAYLDITEVCRERGISGIEIAEELRTSVYEDTGLTCSVGVAPNRLLAKVCSDINKPNGQFVLPNDRMAVMTFISSLPIRKIGGIGKVTEHILRDVFGINTCEEMLQKGSLLCALFSHSTADFFLSVGLGLGGTNTPQARFRKSISNERTFSATEDKPLLYRKLAEIAEMLSADMQKEGLRGRTLTLKLKTASFEVRTRAVTLQKCISSSEDILKHASVLLKAELPVSLRLIGLRMTQFNEDKVRAPSDPTQKTLTNFITPGDASKRTVGDKSSLGSDINDDHLIDDKETSASLDVSETNHYEFGDPFHDNCLPDLDDDDHSFSNKVSEVEKIHKNEVSQLLEGNSLVLQKQEGSYCDRVEGVDKDFIPDIKVGTSSNQKDPFIWVDDYKCSLCGTELPSSFIEERQEHSDFHLAERLQKEESGSDLRILNLRQRCVRNHKDHNASHRKHKKQKLFKNEGRHIPIDVFFAKRNQNI